jgi:hypothetical protein
MNAMPRVKLTHTLIVPALLLLGALQAASLLCAQGTAPPNGPPPMGQSDAPVSANRPPADPMGRPLAIVPLDNKIPGYAAEVTGAVQVVNGRAFVGANAVITSGSQTSQVTLPYRGTLRVCASTTVKLAADASVPSSDVPGLMMALEQGAVEASFATGRNSDFLLTPDFRILIGGPGAADVKVRLGPHGDTCVDNAGTAAPYVLVTSVFDGGAYRVQSGQRVMFQHGSLHEVVDQEKEPCGCPPAVRNSNDFPLAESEGLAPTLHPAPVPQGQLGQQQSAGSLTYNAAPLPPPASTPSAQPPTGPPPPPAPAADTAATQPPPPTLPPAPQQKKRNFLGKVGHFFRKVFGADQ